MWPKKEKQADHKLLSELHLFEHLNLDRVKLHFTFTPVRTFKGIFLNHGVSQKVKISRLIPFVQLNKLLAFTYSQCKKALKRYDYSTPQTQSYKMEAFLYYTDTQTTHSKVPHIKIRLIN